MSFLMEVIVFGVLCFCGFCLGVMGFMIHDYFYD